MSFADVYLRQATLLLRILPFVATERCFAMKGGTAINMFVGDLPRLSVDIDLTYLPLLDRAAALAEIEAALLRVRTRIVAALPGCRILPSRSGKGVVARAASCARPVHHGLSI